MEAWSARRAIRYGVNWPVRVRRVDDGAWHAGRALNLSVTGVLVQTKGRYRIGERVEVEIEFLSHPHAKTIVSGMGYIVRQNGSIPGSAAIQFSIECELKRRATAMQ